MKRVRWLNVVWSKPIQQLVNDFKSHAFTQNKTSGFILDKLLEKHIIGRYIERKEINEKTVDPFGQEVIYQKVLFEQTEFAIFDEYPSIEIYNAPRSFKSFISRLLEFCDFNLTVSHFQVDLFRWFEELEKLINSPIQVEAVQITDYEFDKEVQAKISLNSEHDVRHVLNKLEKEKPLCVSNARVCLVLFKQPVKILFYANSTVHFPEMHEDYLLPLLRESLEKANSQNKN